MPTSRTDSLILPISGLSVHAQTAGRGSPLLLLHGYPDTSALWRSLMNTIGADHCCLAPDLPGFGKTAAPPDFDYSLKGMATFVDALLNRWAPSAPSGEPVAAPGAPVDIVAHDFGGIWALAWATRYPQRVRRLVLMNTAYQADSQWHALARVWRTPFLGELSHLLTTRRAFESEVRRASPGVSDSYLRTTYDAMSRASQRSALRLYRAHDPRTWAEDEQAMLRLTAQKRTLVVWGDRDPYMAHTFADRFGAARVVHLPQVGHCVPAEAPDSVAQEVRDFLSA